MKILNLSAFLLTIAALLSFTQKDAETKITVTVTGFKNAKGNCIANLYNKSDGFPNSSKLAYKTTVVKIINNSAQIVFDNLEPALMQSQFYMMLILMGYLIKIYLGFPRKDMALQIIFCPH